MVESMHRVYWARCTYRNCRWEGAMRSDDDKARQDENEHWRDAHGWRSER